MFNVINCLNAMSVAGDQLEISNFGNFSCDASSNSAKNKIETLFLQNISPNDNKEEVRINRYIKCLRILDENEATLKSMGVGWESHTATQYLALNTFQSIITESIDSSNMEKAGIWTDQLVRADHKSENIKKYYNIAKEHLNNLKHKKELDDLNKKRTWLALFKEYSHESFKVKKMSAAWAIMIASTGLGIVNSISSHEDPRLNGPLGFACGLLFVCIINAYDSYKDCNLASSQS